MDDLMNEANFDMLPLIGMEETQAPVVIPQTVQAEGELWKTLTRSYCYVRFRVLSCPSHLIEAQEDCRLMVLIVLTVMTKSDAHNCEKSKNTHGNRVGT